MIIILVIAIVITNILKYGTHIRTSEGFESGAESKDAPIVPDAAPEPVKSTEVDTTTAIEGNKLGDMKAKYNELMALQKQIVSGVQSVYEPLQKAEGIVSGMKENMRNVSGR